MPASIIVGQSDYHLQGMIEQLLQSQFTVLNLDKEYAANITWQIAVDSRETQQIIDAIYELTNGVVLFKQLKE